MLRTLSSWTRPSSAVGSIAWRGTARFLCADVKEPGDGVGRVVVIGGGSLGSLFSGRLAALKPMKNRVWLLTQWQEHLMAISEMKGLVVKEEGTAGSGSMMGGVRPASSVRDILETRTEFANKNPGRFQTVVFLAVKQGGMRQAAEQAAQILSELRGGLCVTLLNGMGHIDIVKSAFRYHDVRAEVAHGLFYGGAHMPGPGVVVHAGKGHLELGFVNKTDAMSETLLNDVCQVLQCAGIDANVNKNITAAAWEKLVVNASVNALTAILRVRNGVLPAHAPSTLIMQRACEEAHAVAVASLAAAVPAASSVSPNDVTEDSPPPPTVQPPARPQSTPLLDAGAGACFERVVAVAQATGANKSSMLSDVLSGRGTEVESINGFVVREGHRLGVKVAVNEALLLLVQAIEDVPDEEVIVE